MKKVLIISSSPRKNGNSQILCDAFYNGAIKNNDVTMVRLQDLKLNFCLACDYCMKHKKCIQNDDMANLIELYKNADVLVLATPIYFYGISAQLKTFIDRLYPIWQNLGKKEVYYIVSAGLGLDIVNRSLSDLDGFVEHLEDYVIKDKIFALNVMDRGLIKGKEAEMLAYNAGLNC